MFASDPLTCLSGSNTIAWTNLATSISNSLHLSQKIPTVEYFSDFSRPIGILRKATIFGLIFNDDNAADSIVSDDR